MNQFLIFKLFENLVIESLAFTPKAFGVIAKAIKFNEN